MDQPIEKSGDSAAADGPSTSFDGTSTSFDGPSTISQSTGKCISKTTEQDGGEREEIVKLWRQMDEKLEHKAKSHNLSAAESNGASRETEVVVVPRAERTFLNVDYGHNEDDDEDYNPDLDEADAGSEAEGEVEIDDNETNLDDSSSSLQVVEERETDQPALHTRSRYPNTDTTADDEPLCGDDVLLFSTVDDPDYVDFISTLNDPSRYEVDEAEDPEYNFMRDLEYEEIPERDELRMDRGTEIPMREVENLLQDLIDSGLTNTQSEAEQTINAEVSKHTREESAHKHIKRPSSASRRFCEQQFTDHVTVLMGANVDDLAKLSPESACLDGISIEKPPKFTAFEIEQLRIQLTKNELYEHSSNNASTSIFNIRNLEASIVTCHDAINCERVEFPELDEHHSRYKRLNLPLPQTMLVLARSRALLYPELMPAVTVCLL
ncbi:unnamed protein product [Toxocara canis]|uniref:Reverse transcriptase domain-containing protein n=1 Tax=Toxocara canis TaxID=6265 RepID=A0A183V9B1_TOXCA|nr:unnamed protein product [Toxocara canis]